MSGGGAGSKSGGNPGGGSPGASGSEHWSEAVRRRVRSVADRRTTAPGADADSADESAAADGPPPSKSPDDPARAVRERVERRLREAGVADGAESRPSGAADAGGPEFPPPAGGGFPPAEAPTAPASPVAPGGTAGGGETIGGTMGETIGETMGETIGAAAPVPADPDWEDASWEEAEVAVGGERDREDSLRGRLARFLATCGPVGRLPFAPGTFGAVLGLGAWYLTAGLAAPVGAGAFLLATLAGTWAAGRYAAAVREEDPQEVVVDEFCGMWLALLGVAPSLPGGASVLPAALLAFLLFRGLDIAKPPPIRQLERLPGGLGIMADDLAAGALARLVVFLVFGV